MTIKNNKPVDQTDHFAEFKKSKAEFAKEMKKFPWGGCLALVAVVTAIVLIVIYWKTILTFLGVVLFIAFLVVMVLFLLDVIIRFLGL